ncbi:MAG: DMT family transporter [Candidatus Hermodarchaeota archaeon]|nr:DMT family transporter [Candidatus Hermodarchaeota archaeon]
MKLGSWKYYILLILAMVFWGGSWVSVKIVVSNAPPMTVGFFRFLTASLIFIPILLVTHREDIQSYTRRDIGLFFVLGLVGVLGYGVLFLVGMQFTSSAQGSIIAGVNPITVSLLAFLLLNERLAPKWRYLGFLFSFLGIFFVVGVQSFLEFRPDYLIGNLILLCGMLTWGLYSVLGKKVMTRYSSLETTAIGIFFGTVLFFGAALTEQFWTLPIMADPAFWLHILYLGIFVTVVGFLFYFIGIENLGASRAAVFISLVPVFGTLFSILILSEPLYWTFIVGLILVVIGILVINYPRKEKTTNTATNP